MSRRTLRGGGGAGTSVARHPNAVVAVLGDSRSVLGYTAPTSTDGPLFGGLSYITWAGLLSSGKVKFGGVYATSGYTTTQVLATWVPAIIAASPKPAYAIDLSGRNDVPIGGSTSKTNKLAMWAALAAAGIVPILATETPSDDQAAGTVETFNEWIRYQATLLGYPLVDLFAATADPTNGHWLSGYSSDGIHPTITGAKAMGQAVADVLDTLVEPEARALPTLAVTNVWPNLSGVATSNALALTTSSGVPTGWAKEQGGGANPSVTAMSAGEGVGNWVNFTRVSTDTLYRTSGFGTVVPGHKMALGFKLKTSGIAAGSPNALLRIQLVGTSQVKNLCSLNPISGVDVALGTFYREFTVPASAETTIKLWVRLEGADFTASIGQLTLVDLTAHHGL